MIRDVVLAAHAAGRPVTVCGEMAADPRGALALAAFQVDALSVPVGQLASARRVFSEQSPEKLKQFASELVGLDTAGQARELLRNAFQQ